MSSHFRSTYDFYWQKYLITVLSRIKQILLFNIKINLLYLILLNLIFFLIISLLKSQLLAETILLVYVNLKYLPNSQKKSEGQGHMMQVEEETENYVWVGVGLMEARGQKKRLKSWKHVLPTVFNHLPRVGLSIAITSWGFFVDNTWEHWLMKFLLLPLTFWRGVQVCVPVHMHTHAHTRMHMHTHTCICSHPNFYLYWIRGWLMIGIKGLGGASKEDGKYSRGRWQITQPFCD